MCKDYSNQNSMVLAQKQKYRSTEQDRSPEINPHTQGQLICDKGGKIYNGEKTVSSISGTGKTGKLHVKK